MSRKTKPFRMLGFKDRVFGDTLTRDRMSSGDRGRRARERLTPIHLFEDWRGLGRCHIGAIGARCRTSVKPV
jgi:hypothetical protein